MDEWVDIAWYNLEPDRAQALGERFHAQAHRRREWLSEQTASLRSDGNPSAVDLMVPLWDWFRGWVQEPVGAEEEPTPAWLVPKPDPRYHAVPYSREQAIGGEAVFWFYADALTAAVPQLKWTVGRSGSEKNEPTLLLPGHRHTPMGGPLHAHHFVKRAIAGSDYGVREVYEHYLGRAAELRGHARSSPESSEVVVYVERTDDPEFRWEVGVDDVSGYEHQDLVEAFALDLSTVPGVAEVVHQDREQILIRGKVTKKALSAFAGEWWGARVPSHRLVS